MSGVEGSIRGTGASSINYRLILRTLACFGLFVVVFALCTWHTISFSEIIQLIILTSGALSTIVEWFILGTLTQVRRLVKSLLISTEMLCLVIMMLAGTDMDTIDYLRCKIEDEE
jgi:hypothetical protein